MSKILDKKLYPAGFYKNKIEGKKVVYLDYKQLNVATIYLLDSEDYQAYKNGYITNIQLYEMLFESQEIIILGIKNGTIVLVK